MDISKLVVLILTPVYSQSIQNCGNGGLDILFIESYSYLNFSFQ